MPEGHTIHKAARNQRVLVGKLVRASSPQGRFTEVAQLDRARLVDIEPLGKHLFYRFERRGRVRRLHVHLGLAGRFRLHSSPPPAPVGAVRLRLVTDEQTLDLRGPLICELVDDITYAAARARLGPDPIAPRSSPARFRTRLARTRVSIGAMLLDQSVIAGVGNVYRAELLFLAGIDPRRPSRDLTRVEVDHLWQLARMLLRAGVTDGRIVTTRYGGADLPAAPKWRRTYAYKQRECLRCGSAIDRVKLAGRPCFFCPHCQR